MPDVEINCLLDPPLENWTHHITCRTMPMLVSGLEALAEYICANPPSEFDEFIELLDAPASYVGEAGKLVAVNGAEDGLEFVDNVATDELVKVSVNDTTAGYLLAKLAQGNGITLTETNDGGDEDVTITVNQSQLALASLGTKSHTSLTDIGTNTHPQIDTHIASTANPHATTLEQARTANSVMSGGFTVNTGAIVFNENAGDSDFRVEGQTDANLFFSDASINSIAIGNNSPLAKFHVTGTSDNEVAIFRGNAIQTANLSEWQNSAGTVLTAIGRSGSVSISQPVLTGSVPSSVFIISAAHTALTAATERNEILFNLSATQQFATGAIATQRSIRIQAPTYGFVAASTITTAATLAISNSPQQGTNATITNAYALLIEGGNIGLSDTTNIILGTTTGTKIGTDATQKLAFWNKAPVIQPTALATQLTTVTFTAPGAPDYAFATVQLAGFGFSTEDEGNTLLSVVANLQIRLSELETRLSTIGILP